MFFTPGMVDFVSLWNFFHLTFSRIRHTLRVKSIRDYAFRESSLRHDPHDYAFRESSPRLVQRKIHSWSNYHVIQIYVITGQKINPWLLSPGNWISVTTQFSVFLLFARFSCFLFFFPRPSLSSRVTRPIVLTPPLFYFYPDKKLRQKHIAIHYTIHSDNI